MESLLLEIFEPEQRRQILRVVRERALERALCLVDFTLREQHPPQVGVRELVTAITLGSDRLLEPGNRFLSASQTDQVDADVVVGVAEFRVEAGCDRALLDRLLDLAEMAQRPAEKGVGVGRRVDGDRRAKGFDRALIVAHQVEQVAHLGRRTGALLGS